MTQSIRSGNTYAEAQTALKAAPGKFVIITRKNSENEETFLLMKKITNFIVRFFRKYFDKANYYTKEEERQLQTGNKTSSLVHKSSVSLEKSYPRINQPMTPKDVKKLQSRHAKMISELTAGQRLFAIFE